MADRDEMPTEEYDALAEELAGSSFGDDAMSELQSQLDAERDKSLRLQAELQNVLNRKSRELAEERRYAALPVVRDLLPVLDNINRAIEAAQKSPDPASLLQGFELVRQQLLTVLTQQHCETISTEGEAFNPEFHAAILQQPSSEIPAGHIVMSVQAGYKLHDRVVRPAQVIVSAGSGQ
jgi:molecular chaperone GrpE